jgi:hypothetical protein
MSRSNLILSGVEIICLEAATIIFCDLWVPNKVILDCEYHQLDDCKILK